VERSPGHRKRKRRKGKKVAVIARVQEEGKRSGGKKTWPQVDWLNTFLLGKGPAAPPEGKKREKKMVRFFFFLEKKKRGDTIIPGKKPRKTEKRERKTEEGGPAHETKTTKILQTKPSAGMTRRERRAECPKPREE